MKIIVAGSREFNNYSFMEEKLDFYLQNQGDIVIISGAARGADKLGEQYATNKGYEIIICKAQWDQLGKKAGYIRNEEMAKIADAAVIFWDGVSKGTKHMIDLSKKYNLKLRIIKF